MFASINLNPRLMIGFCCELLKHRGGMVCKVIDFFYFFFIKFSISILRLQTFRLNRFYERKWKGQDIVKLILCPLLDEVNLF